MEASSSKTARYLGATFLAVVFTSFTAGLMLAPAIGSGGISSILVNVSNHTQLLRLAVLDDLLTSAGVVVLAALLYTTLRAQNEAIARIAFGLWLAEAMALAFSMAGALALIPLSSEFVRAGAPDQSYYQAFGDFLYNSVAVGLGQTRHMFFYLVGGALWYSLFYRAGSVPRVISIYGLAAVAVGLVGIVADLLGSRVSIFVFLPILPFELVIGGWLVLKGIPAGTTAQRPVADRARRLSVG